MFPHPERFSLWAPLKLSAHFLGLCPSPPASVDPWSTPAAESGKAFQ